MGKVSMLVTAGVDCGDEAVWARVRAGETAAFGALFDRHADAVYRVALVRLRLPEAAEDIVSIVFAEAWRQRLGIELLDGSLKPWLLGVARNQINRSLAQRARRPTEPLSDLDVGDTSPDPGEQVARSVDASSDLDGALAALDDLPERYRDALILHVWGEMGHAETASTLGVAVGTVKSRINRARAQLRWAIRPPGHHPENQSAPRDGGSHA